MANFIYGAITLTGGGFGALDAIDGNKLLDLDNAVAFVDGTTYFYQIDANSGAAEDVPDRIKPDINAGDKVWILLKKRSWQYTVATYTSSDTIASDIDVVVGDTSGGTFTLTLPSAALKDTIRIHKGHADYILNVLPNGSDTIEGAASIALNNIDDSVILVSNGTNRWAEY